MSEKHVLLLDGDDNRRRELVQLLREAGIVVVAERTGAEASAALVAGPGGATPGFDLLLLDLAASGLDLDLLREALAPAKAAVPDSLAAAERRHIARVLEHTRGNRRQAALLLGISRSTLLNKIRKYQLE